jgi:hypothetical protein
VLLDVDGFWQPLVQFFDAAVEHGFVRPAHRVLLRRTETVDEAIALATGPVPETPHKWMDRDRTGRGLASETRQTSDTRRTPTANPHEMDVS